MRVNDMMRGRGWAVPLLLLCALACTVHAQAPDRRTASVCQLEARTLAGPGQPHYGDYYSMCLQARQRIPLPENMPFNALRACADAARGRSDGNPLDVFGDYDRCVHGDTRPAVAGQAPGQGAAVVPAAVTPVQAPAPAGNAAVADAEYREAQQLEAQHKIADAEFKYQDAAADGSQDAHAAYCRMHYDFARRQTNYAQLIDLCSKVTVRKSDPSKRIQPLEPYHFGTVLEAAEVRKFDLYGFRPGMTMSEVISATPKRLHNAIIKLDIDPLGFLTGPIKVGSPTDLGAANIERHENAAGEVGLVITHTELADQRVATKIGFCKQAHGALLAYSVYYDAHAAEASVENGLKNGLVSMGGPSDAALASMVAHAKQKYSQPTLEETNLLFWGKLKRGPPVAAWQMLPDRVGDESEPYLKVDLSDGTRSAFIIKLDDPGVDQACQERRTKSKAQKAEAATQQSF